MRDLAKKKANDARRHAERMKNDFDYRMRKLFNTIRARCLLGKGRKDAEWYFGLPVTITVEDLKAAWRRDGAQFMRRPSIDRKESPQGYTPDNIQFIEFADNLRKMIPTRRPRRARKNIRDDDA